MNKQELKEVVEEVVKGVLKDELNGLKKELGELKKELGELKDELTRLSIRVDNLESKLEKIRISFYAVEEGIVRGKGMKLRIRRYREGWISDPRSFNSLRQIKSRHY